MTREVGVGFEAYVRVLHPYGKGDESQSWAHTAALHGKTMHPAVSWAEITTHGPWTPDERYHGNDNGGVYLEGNLPRPVLTAACRRLREHTTTPEQCFFAVWDGWGWDGGVTVTFASTDGVPPPPAMQSTVRLDPDAPRFSVPHRDFLLYAGVIEQALEIGGGDFYPVSGFFCEQSPTWRWPADHAWCLSTELDAEYTIVGGSAALARQLLIDDDIEALVVAPDEPSTSNINL